MAELRVSDYPERDLILVVHLAEHSVFVDHSVVHSAVVDR